MIAKLPKRTEDTIQHLIETGEFADSEAVLVQAVDELALRREQAAQLRALLQPSIEQVDRGEYREFTPEVRREIWEAALRRYAAGDTPGDHA
jgi:Arc/MetJ-type ribon-helix-helix transcriptional regulator